MTAATTLRVLLAGLFAVMAATAEPVAIAGTLWFLYTAVDR